MTRCRCATSPSGGGWRWAPSTATSPPRTTCCRPLRWSGPAPWSDPPPEVTLAGRVAVVTGAAAPVGRGVALALGRAGAGVGLVGPGAARGPVDELVALGAPTTVAPSALDRREEAEAALAAVVTELGPLHVAVHTWVPAMALERVPLSEVDDERWEAVWEATMAATIGFLQAAFSAFRGGGGDGGRRGRGGGGGGGGRIVVVTPTAWATGAPGLAPYSAAVEGQ